VGLPFRISSGPVTIGVSVGVALDRDHQSAEALFDAADSATYRSKLAGRHIVTVAT